MTNNDYLNLIEEIHSLKVNFVLRNIINLIAEKPGTNISNSIILWNNQVNDQSEPLLQEDIKGSFPIKTYFSNGLFKLKEAVGPLSGSDMKLLFPNICGENIIAMKSICILPVENYFNQSKAVIIYFSFNVQNGIDYSKEQIILLQKIINELFNSQSFYLYEHFENLIASLSNFSKKQEESGRLSEKYDELSKVLEPFKKHICHFSIWKIDNLNKLEYQIIKEKYQNFKGAKLENGHFIIKNTDYHPISKYINEFINHPIKESINKSISLVFSECIHSKFYKQNDDPKSCLTPKYCNEVGIKDGETIVLSIPIVPRENIKYDFINVLCIYINNIHLTPFKSPMLLSIISNKIYETFTLHNKIITNQTTEEILKATVSSADLEENAFYREAIRIFKEKNECESCFIYFRNNLTDSYDFKSYDRYETKDISIKDIAIPIPIKLLQDDIFINFLKDYLEENVFKKLDDEDGIYYGSDKIVKSALVLPIFNQKKKKSELTCFALFINKNIHKGEDEKNSQFFLIHNENIIRPSLEYVNKYHQFKEAANNKDTLLKRIRHEIPNEVNLIRQNAEIIKELLKSNVQFIGHGSKQHYLNVINQLSLSNMRIDLFAGFATTVGFETPKIMSKMEHLNLSIFLSSMIDIFQIDALGHGVRVRFVDYEEPVILYVSQLYKLSIINLISNAIRYSYFGTCVVIKVTEHSISVKNIGIPINEEDKLKIYKENYRGEMAKTNNQDGLGYGLFLAKKIIETHKGHKLSHTSSPDLEKNLYGTAALYNLFSLKVIDFKQKMNIYNNQLDEEDKHTVAEFNKEQNKIYSLLNNNPNRYFQIDIDTAKDWIFNKFFHEKIMYDDFVQMYLSGNTYKTIFTIQF